MMKDCLLSLSTDYQAHTHRHMCNHRHMYACPYAPSKWAGVTLATSWENQSIIVE